MAFDFTKIKAQAKEERQIDPVVIFQGLRGSDTSINDLWLAQGDALRGWHEKRNQSDVAVSLNTGAGKTLVGLLIGQSLVNETRSLVLYACSSIQLVSQTEAKALGYGLPVTTYVRGLFSNDLARKGEAVCLTTYHALFNGRSVFAKKEYGSVGIVFDDAHAAEHLLRDHFSLHVSKEHFGSIYAFITKEFSRYFHSVGLSSSFEEVAGGVSGRLLLVHPSEVKRSHATILKSIRESTVPTDGATVFAWEHLKDRLDLCAFIISGTEITITPPFIPVRTLPYFSKNIRRVYLSATISASDVFVRTFGREPSSQIRPTTTAGECERMILFPERVDGVTNDVAVTQDVIRPHKALVLTPSYPRAGVWADLVKPPPKDRASETIEAFKQAKESEKLLLAARYDGLDLPGEMCRIVVIDDLPTGIGPLEKYLWDQLGFSRTLRTAVASRVVQSFGRISRGMSDHGIAFVTGKRLVQWLQVPINLACLPSFLQKQLQLGLQISEGLKATDIASIVKDCLTRNKNWLASYETFMREATAETPVTEPKDHVSIALAEATYGETLWDRDYNGAAACLRKTLDVAGSISVNAACWHKLWLGFALEHAGDKDTARTLYIQAHAGHRNIPPLSGGVQFVVKGVAEQAAHAGQQFEINAEGRVQVPRSMDRDLLHLDGSGTPKQTEEALRYLGQYLGLHASRPDNEHGTGPDVLWIFPDKVALCVDAKTDKEAASVYRKEELGQLADHVQWVRDNHEVDRVIPGFVGPEVSASDSANPQENVKVACLRKFDEIGGTLKAVYRDVAANSLPLTVAPTVQEQFERRGLLWPRLEAALCLVELRSLEAR